MKKLGYFSIWAFLWGEAKVSRIDAVLIGAGLLLLGAAGGFTVGQNGFPAAGRPVEAPPAKAAVRSPGGSVRLPPRSFDRWTLGCVQNAQGALRCVLLLRVADSARRQPPVTLALSRGRKEAPVLLVVTPPNVALQAGVALSAGAGPEVRFEYVNCTPSACHAVHALDDPLRMALARGGPVRLRCVLVGGQVLSYEFPVGGFGDGYAAWTAERRGG